MLGTANVNAVLAVKDLAAARRFYENILGLQVEKESPYEVYYKSGNSRLSIYSSSYAGTNQATAASWEVDNVADTVQVLESAGIVFEEFDLEGDTREGPIHTMEGSKAAWFKDPDGNTLCVHQEA